MTLAVTDTIVSIVAALAGTAIGFAATAVALVLQQRHQRVLDEARFAGTLMHHIDEAYRVGVRRAFESLQLAEQFRGELGPGDGGLTSADLVLRDLEEKIGPVPDELVRQVRAQWPLHERASL